MAVSVNKNFIFSVISIFLGISFSLVIAEIILRVLGIGYGNAPLVSDPVLHHTHPANYRFVSHIPGGEYGGHLIFYDDEALVADPDGLPDTSRPKNYRVAFMGDSFTEAGQVAFSDSFVGRLQNSSAAKAELKNYGVASYSPVLYLLQWREQVRNFRPTHVFVLLYSNDISDDAKREKRLIYSAEGEIVALPGPEDGWWKIVLRKFYLARFLRKIQLQLAWMKENRNEIRSVSGGLVEQHPEISELSSRLLETLTKEVEAFGGELVLMVVPSKYRLSGGSYERSELQFSDKWRLWAEKRDIHFVDLVKPFEQAVRSDRLLFFEKDIHFTEQGHAVVAKTLITDFPEVFVNDGP